MGKNHRIVAAVHNHINILGKAVETGDISPTEKLAAIERFIRWHTRMAELGRQLLAKLGAEGRDGIQEGQDHQGGREDGNAGGPSGGSGGKEEQKTQGDCPASSLSQTATGSPHSEVDPSV